MPDQIVLLMGFGAMFALFGAPFGIAATIIFLRRRAFLSRAIVVQGQVIAMDGVPAAAPVVQYDFGGMRLTMTGNYRRPIRHRVGEILAVWVDPLDPHRADLADSKSRAKASLFFILGSAFGIPGVLLLALASVAAVQWHLNQP